MKNLLVICVKTLCVLLLCICIGTGLITLAYMIPVDRMEPYVRNSQTIFEDEGAYPNLFDFCTSTLDNWSDANMILCAIYDGPENFLDNAMNVRQYRAGGANPVESVIKYYDTPISERTVSPWARYWCGFLVVLKPLLTMLDYRKIRIINIILQTCLNMGIVFVLFKKKLGKLSVPYIISIGLLMPLTTAFCMFYSTVFYIFSICSLIILFKCERWKDGTNFIYFFLITGAMTSFMDYLSYPLATFGIPIIFYLFMVKEARGGKMILRQIIFLCAWGVGYVGMWAGKWCVASLILKKNMFKSAIGTVLLRTSTSSSDGTNFSLVEMIGRNIKQFVNTPVFIAFILCIVVFVVMAIIQHRVRILGKCISEFGLIAILPFVWYLGASNHSYIHYFFTHKELVITAFAIMAMGAKCICLDNTDETEVQKDIR